MSSHPNDSQPPEDHLSDALDPANDEDFWNLDDSETDDFCTPDTTVDKVAETTAKTTAEQTKSSVSSLSTAPSIEEDDEDEDEDFWDINDTKSVSVSHPQSEPSSRDSSLSSTDNNKAFWDLNNQYDDTNLEAESPFAEPDQDTTQKPSSSNSSPSETEPKMQVEPVNSTETKTKVTTEAKNETPDSTPAISAVSTSTVIASPAATNTITKEASPSNNSAEQTDSQETESQKESSDQPKVKIGRSPFEWICSGLCYLGIIAIFAYLVHYASQQHDFETGPSYTTDVPVSGEFASIASVETWWEKPATPASAKYGVILVPVAKITLADDSKSGSIRSLFFNPTDEIFDREGVRKGDTVTKEFRDGKFVETGTNEITVYATDGYDQEAHYNYYRSQDEERWTVEIREMGADQSASDFKYLAKAPIDPIIK